MPNETSKEELQERAQLVRIFEASCDIEHPTDHELNFRLAVMKKIGSSFKLAEVKPLQITGPFKGNAVKPAAK